MKKIVIVGIGQGGILAAEKLSGLDYEIEIFEQKERKNLTYDWHDDVSKQIFKRVGLPLIDKKYYFEKNNWTFFAPFSKKPFRIKQDKEKLDYSIERRPLIEMMIDRVPSTVKIHFSTPVKALWLEEEKVVGVELENGQKIAADLVIDSAGAKSPLRRSLPESYGIQKRASVNELFYAYRAFYESIPVEKIEDTNKVYLKHIGEKGISWCIADPSGLVNVLVGRIGVLNEYDVNKAINELKKDNPIIGKKVVRGGQTVCIPVRYPLTKMIGEGYLAIGDSAFMTIPLLGSGIASSMLAATILYEVLAKNSDLSEENLWKYQVAFYRECGAKHCAVDLMKRWLLTAKDKDLVYMFDKGILNHDDMKRASVGELVKVDFISAMQKSKFIFKRPILLCRLLDLVVKSQNVYRLGLKIPENYDIKKILKWENKIRKFYKTSKIEESPV